jgi:hypothetical protein
MATERIFWNFKDTELTRPDLDQFLGATYDRWEPGTILRFRCRRATRDAHKKAQAINSQGRVTVIIEELGARA